MLDPLRRVTATDVSSTNNNHIKYIPVIFSESNCEVLQTQTQFIQADRQIIAISPK